MLFESIVYLPLTSIWKIKDCLRNIMVDVCEVGCPVCIHLLHQPFQPEIVLLSWAGFKSNVDGRLKLLYLDDYKKLLFKFTWFCNYSD